MILAIEYVWERNNFYLMFLDCYALLSIYLHVIVRFGFSDVFGGSLSVIVICKKLHKWFSVGKPPSCPASSWGSHWFSLYTPPSRPVILLYYVTRTQFLVWDWEYNRVGWLFTRFTCFSSPPSTAREKDLSITHNMIFVF